MGLLPRNRFAKAGLVVVGLLVALACVFRLDRVAGYLLSAKAEGDVLFQSLPRDGWLVDAIEGITGSEWSHCGILVKREGRWYVAEAIDTVSYTPLHWWLLRGRGSRIMAYRNTHVGEIDKFKIQQAVDQFVGKEYDLRYAPDDTEIYCSELVYKVFDRAMGLQVGVWQKLRELNWRPYEDFIREMDDGDLPLDQVMVTPLALTRSRDMKLVFSAG